MIIMRKNILVMSGKGGVGKTTVSVNLSYFLYKKGFQVGLLDVDIHGPNALKMLGYENVSLKIKDNKLQPFIVNNNFKIASIAGYVNDNSAIIWRGPRKHGAIKQLSQDIEWGELDYLIVDFPPGTGDEHISTAQLLSDIYGAVIISTPQKVSLMDMNRSFDFCKQMNIPIIGAIENMSDGIFGSDTVKKECDEKNISYLGKIKLSKTIISSSENGKSFIDEEDNELNENFKDIVNNIIRGEKK
jgi:ATP-binding protein involved in chromosome partitioning